MILNNQQTYDKQLIFLCPSLPSKAALKNLHKFIVDSPILQGLLLDF